MKKPLLRIAQVAPLCESVPPRLYGGTERIVSYLTEELVRQGHEVTLFASGDSRTRARLEPVVNGALRLNPACLDFTPHHVLAVERVAQRAAEFDIIHFHLDLVHFPLCRALRLPHATTLHGRLDLPDLAPLFGEFSDLPLISISDSQREPLPRANWLATVYHGLPADLHTYGERPGNYLAFVGRISPEKRPDRAIDLALRSGMELRIAAKVDKADQAYFEQVIKPRLNHPLVRYLGEVGQAEKDELLGGARALVFLIDWPEPFGLAMIEALACGTPVIAWRCGSVPEVIDDGETGFIVDDMDQAADAVQRIDTLSRRRCREVFERRFSAERMAGNYLAAYRRLLDAPAPLRARRVPT